MSQPDALFSGSYAPEDVQFLLTPMTIAFTDLAEKEHLIQSGQKHYSDMLSEETPPSAMHLALYHNALQAYGPRMAREVIALAKGLAKQITARPIVLTSLVRAGVPLAVCLLHALRDMGVAAVHYGVSIIRDRGLDSVALAMITQRHGTQGVVFIDGWTGKGAIASQLSDSLRDLPEFGIPPRLAVLADPGGCAWLSASGEDWLMPFGILGAPISGLVSRSLWRDDGLHGSMFCQHLLTHDVSRAFVAEIDALRAQQPAAIAPAQVDDAQRVHLRALSERTIAALARKYAVDSVNRIKPGIAEATRAVMRRVPERVLVSNKADADVALLLHLADTLDIRVEEVGAEIGVYRAVTLIKKVER